MSHQSQVPTVIADYFATHIDNDGARYVLSRERHPVIVQTFRPGVGWKTYPFTKRVSRSWVRKLRAEGVTSIAVASPVYPNRVVDFRVTEVLR